MRLAVTSSAVAGVVVAVGRRLADVVLAGLAVADGTGTRTGMASSAGGSAASSAAAGPAFMGAGQGGQSTGGGAGSSAHVKRRRAAGSNL